MITRYTPVERLRSFDRFSKMMEDMLGNEPFGWMAPWTPAVDVKETEKEIAFFCELPGISEKDIDIELVGDLLTISGKRELNQEEKREDYVRIERSYGTFQRSFTLDGPAKPEDVKASFKDGILMVTVPKTAAVQPRKVPIKAV